MTGKPILDNRADGGKAGDFLRKAITPGSQVRAVSAYFSIYAHHELRDELDAASDFRFLFGDPASVAVKTHDDAVKPFILGEDGNIAPHYNLRQKYAAQECARWLQKESVQVRTLKEGLLHGKMYMTDMPNGASAAFCGSSNFTARGLGFAPGGGNWELNITADDKTRAALREWFDILWKSGKVCDAKEQMLEALSQLGKNQSPAFIYYLTLYRLFKEELEAAQQQESDLSLKDSQIWQMLYRFQKDAVSGIIRRLARHRVCILADSVGLGKTYTALAVMKHYEKSDILVLCPKRLEQNWKQFSFTHKNNPLAGDRLRYEIRAHTDLGSNNKKNKDFAWDRFNLVVIDESHYFRNSTGERYKQLRAALDQSNARVLMLSATPINTSLKDLRNQIWLGAADNAFNRDMNIGSVEQLATVSQRAFVEWTKSGARDKNALIESMPGNFLKLMDAVTVARSRSLIKKVYTAEDGGKLDFPKLGETQTLSMPTDTEGELVYADIHRRIGEFGLSIYSPSDYLLREDENDKKHLVDNFTQQDREHYLIGMMRVNFLKRLESSPYAFCQTLGRTIDKIAKTEEDIARFLQKKASIIREQTTIPGTGKESQPSLNNRATDTADSIPEEEDMEDMGEDENWTVGKKKIYNFEELRLNEWLEDLQKDRKTLKGLLETAKRVEPKRDAKLAKLKELLRDKIQNPTTNKDGGENRKALLFTSYADTAQYVYDELKPLAAELGVAIALVVGSGDNDTTAKGSHKNYGDILHDFSPRGQKPHGEEITILIATDCVSEGQNLQDCDYVINYDIHWNPVRIVQRFGRIDRIGSKAERIRMANFWPAIDLNKYLNLKHRVEARMALVEIGGSGTTTGEKEEATKLLEFRNKQLLDLYNNNIDADAIDADGVGVSDFTLADFLAELLAYLQNDKYKFDNAPNGLCAVVAAEPDKNAHAGVIFCLCHKDAPAADGERRKDNRLHPYYLVYVRDDGRMHYSHTSAIRSLRLFGELCRGKTEYLPDLCAAFDRENEDKSMPKYNTMLQAAIRDIAEKFQTGALGGLSADRGAKLPMSADYPSKADDFVLTSWLVIRDNR
ncbi:MAG: helicase-related protein [Gammaproteobacteria bacterium]